MEISFLVVPRLRDAQNKQFLQVPKKKYKTFDTMKTDDFWTSTTTKNCSLVDFDTQNSIFGVPGAEEGLRRAYGEMIRRRWRRGGSSGITK